ncbi:MAG TPA: hypothetical protein VM734_04350 [Kofleriaceae bacterium]|jgi:hypothetical protein|nr:hypothetical protein [Kofleriaceae bacterium]
MKKILIAVAMLGLAGACGGNAADELLGKMKEFKDKTCACKDKACLEKVEKDAMEWMMKNADKFKNVKPSKAQDEAADKLDDEMDACKKKIEEAAAPAAP